jgi:hypothetical protein
MKTGSIAESFRRLGLFFAVSAAIERAVGSTDPLLLSSLRFAKEKNVFRSPT